jgi:hypothetical protein
VGELPTAIFYRFSGFTSCTNQRSFMNLQKNKENGAKQKQRSKYRLKAKPKLEAVLKLLMCAA